MPIGPTPEIELRSAWRLHDLELEQDAKAFWAGNGLLPIKADADVRVGDLCALAYFEGKPVAVSTAIVRENAALRCKLAMFRCAVAPEHRWRGIARKITVFTRDTLEQWSLENPGAQICGMGTVVESKDLDAGRPLWRASRLGLVGYTPKGLQLRVAWFDHARVC